MEQEVVFIPLGGGQRVGASCYYLKLGTANVILDAGVGVESGLRFVPDFRFLLTSPLVQSMGQINQVFVSHAHTDHIGYLLELMRQATHADVYMTEITKVLAEYQLYDRFFVGGGEKDENRRLATRNLLDKITIVSFMQTLFFGKYKATLYPAGHIPGAMMTLFEFGKRKILYTGDYSLNSTTLTQGCAIPDGLEVDTVIMCGLHAKHPDYRKRSEAMFRQANFVLQVTGKSGRSLMCRIPQLSKGIEFLKRLNDLNVKGIPIYLDESVMNMVRKMESLSMPVLNQYNRIIGGERPVEPHIYLTSDSRGKREAAYESVKIDFSLHEDFSEMKQFLKKLNPHQAVLVHCGKASSALDRTIEQEMMLDGECRTQFVFAEENEIYRL